MKFYDSIPERAKYWERESYDATRSLFQSKRNEKRYNYNQQIMINYNPLPQDSSSSSEEEYNESRKTERVIKMNFSKIRN